MSEWQRKKINGVFMYWHDMCDVPCWISKNYRDRIVREVEEDLKAFALANSYMNSEGKFIARSLEDIIGY